MAAYRRVYDSRHVQADCQETGSAPEPYTLGSRVWATFTFFIVYKLIIIIITVTSSFIKPELHNISQRRRRRSEHGRQQEQKI